MAHADDTAGSARETSRGTSGETDIFANIVGHQGAKVALRGALRDGDTHVLMIGPPGSGKSAFLQSLEENLPEGTVVYADDDTTASRLKKLLAQDPPILLMDELDDVKSETYGALSTPLESGRVRREHADEQIDVQIDTQVIAACNSTARIPDHILSRFQPKIEFDAYSEAEFEEVCCHMLPREVEWVTTETHAKKVARVALDVEGDTDPRIARDIAKMASGPDDVETVARALHDPDAEVGDVSLTVDDIARVQDDVTEERLADLLACEVVNPGDCGVGPEPEGSPESSVEREREVARDVGEDVDRAIEERLAEEAIEDEVGAAEGAP